MEMASTNNHEHLITAVSVAVGLECRNAVRAADMEVCCYVICKTRSIRA